MKKRLLSIFMAAALAFSAAGCGQAPSGQPEQSAPSSAVSQQAAGGSASKTEVFDCVPKTQYPLTITDQLGRQVTIEQEPQRIVSSYYNATSLLLALGLKDRLVGMEMGGETRGIYQLAAPEILQLPAVGSGKTFNLEECIALEPDVVLMPFRQQEFIDKLEDAGLTVIAVAPEDDQSLQELIGLYGQVFNVADRARELNAYYDAKLDQVYTMAMEHTYDLPRVYLSAGETPYTTCTSQMFQDYLIRFCGGDNVTNELSGGYWSNISPEQLIGYDPEIIITVGYADYSVDAFRREERLSQLSAVKNDRLYTFPSSIEPWDYATPSAVLGAAWLYSVFYPEDYPMEQCIQDAQEFYRLFYGIEVTPEELGL